MNHPFISAVCKIIDSEKDRYEVHRQCRPLVEQMANNREFIFSVFRNNLSNQEYLKRTRHYSTLAMEIFINEKCSLVMNIFPPLPNRRTDISFQSIHHHGSLLLTSAGVFGPGYNSILFKKEFELNKTTGIAIMEVEKDYVSKKGLADFVDSRQPHIVFYPAEFSATIAFWCDEKPSAKESLKKFGFINKIKGPLVKIANATGLSALLGVNKLEYFDFYAENGRIHGLKNREAYSKAGSNDNFLKNIFHFVQMNGFDDRGFIEKMMLEPETPLPAIKYFQQLLNGENIEEEFFTGHLDVPHVNLLKADILSSVK